MSPVGDATARASGGAVRLTANLSNRAPPIDRSPTNLGNLYRRNMHEWWATGADEHYWLYAVTYREDIGFDLKHRWPRTTAKPSGGDQDRLERDPVRAVL